MDGWLCSAGFCILCFAVLEVTRVVSLAQSPRITGMRPFLQRVLSAVALLVGLTPAVPAFAWNSNAHQLIARQAEAQLTPKAAGAVHALLALEPGSTLASVSTWADEHRNPTTSAWHYVNFPRSQCEYVEERDCPQGRCVVSALERQVAILGSEESIDKRLLALKYVVHLMADIHQPLHAGFGDDRGGNSHQIQALGRGTNLHALWDGGLGLLTTEGLASLEADVKASMPSKGKTLTSALGTVPSFKSIAEDSCRIASEPTFYPDRHVEPTYLDRYRPTVRQQLSLAAQRLAAILNRALE